MRLISVNIIAKEEYIYRDIARVITDTYRQQKQ